MLCWYMWNLRFREHMNQLRLLDNIQHSRSGNRRPWAALHDRHFVFRALGTSKSKIKVLTWYCGSLPALRWLPSCCALNGKRPLWCAFSQGHGLLDQGFFPLTSADPDYLFLQWSSTLEVRVSTCAHVGYTLVCILKPSDQDLKLGVWHWSSRVNILAIFVDG